MVALPNNNVITSISSSGYYVPPSTLAASGSREGRNTPYPSLEIDVMYHYYMVEPERNLFYVPALFSTPHMSNLRNNKILFFHLQSANWVILSTLITFCLDLISISTFLEGRNLYYVPPMDHVIHVISPALGKWILPN
jgi:hypothetical protein